MGWITTISEIDPATAQTNRPGIYAIGDIATYSHKLKLILNGFAEAAQAAHAIRSFLYPEEILHFIYSQRMVYLARRMSLSLRLQFPKLFSIYPIYIVINKMHEWALILLYSLT